ncbi:MAG: LTA synthase family protein, partial [Deltaproteobacteria bacterium]|nr:LTA synthase family protein [Deltaproteobacteria bacterium]
MRRDPVGRSMGKKKLSRFSISFENFANSSGPTLALFICVLVMILVYRVQLTWALFTSPMRPFDFNPSAHSPWFMVSYLPYDFALLFSIFLFSWLVSHLSTLWEKRRIQTFLNLSGFVLLHLLLISLFLINGAHTRLLFEAQTGMSYFVIQELFLNVPWAELVKFVDWKDGLFLLLPIIIFWGLLFLPFVLRVRALKVSIGLVILLFFFSMITGSSKSRDLPSEIRVNPTLFFLSDIVEHGILRASHKDRYTEKGLEGGGGLQPGGVDYRDRVKPIKFLPLAKDHPWNIVFFIMESVGSRYMFDTSQGPSMPMPFLHGLAKESWHLKNHYTSANISTKAIFSLLSGLYDLFNQETFGIRLDANVPSLQNYLPKGYESFLVTPSPLQWYFPVAFVKNGGLKEMHHFENLNLKVREEKHAFGRYLGRDEVQTIDFFNRRIQQAREPFLGIYLSFTAHLPYFDYGKDYRVVEPDGRTISRYYNNLNLLDNMVKRVYENLKKEGLLERTIFVIVGDHGQAFGQHHADNYMHHRYSYNENLETPAIIHQPALFKPRTFEVPTSHVDLLPTLLDSMRIPYTPEFMDGESLFHHRLSRKFIFVYGYEGTISSIDQHMVKVQYSPRKKRCWAFDLKTDPEENHPLDCSSYGSQVEALRRFVGFHDASLVRYNEAMKEKKRVSGI